MAARTFPPGLVQSTLPDLNGELAADQADGAANGQSRGVLPGSRRRRRRSIPTGKVSGRKLQLPDSVFERLQLTAIKRRSNPSAIAAEILDRNLPKLTIASEE